MRERNIVSMNPHLTLTRYGLTLSANVLQMNLTEIFQNATGHPILGRVTLVDSREPVVLRTLVLDYHHWFFVNGIRVHNKGSRRINIGSLVRTSIFANT